MTPMTAAFDERARKDPGACALVLRGDHLTYGELDALAQDFRTELDRLGGERGAPVCVPARTVILSTSASRPRRGASATAPSMSFSLLRPRWPRTSGGDVDVPMRRCRHVTIQYAISSRGGGGWRFEFRPFAYGMFCGRTAVSTSCAACARASARATAASAASTAATRTKPVA